MDIILFIVIVGQIMSPQLGFFCRLIAQNGLCAAINTQHEFVQFTNYNILSGSQSPMVGTFADRRGDESKL